MPDLRAWYKPIIQNTFQLINTPSTLSPKPLAYDKPIGPTEMPHISTCTDQITDDTNIPTKDDSYPWLDPEDK